MEEETKQEKRISLLPAADLEEALALVWEVFSDCESEHLEQEALDEFWARIDYEYMLQRMGDGELRFWGAYDGDLLVGVCALRELEHIELLYVDSEYQRQGVGTNLLRHAFIDVRKLDEDIHRITTLATPASRGFFLRQGFLATAAEQQAEGLTLIPMALEGKE